MSTASIDIEYDVEYTMDDPDGTFSETAQELLIHTLSLEMIDSLHASSCGRRLESSTSSSSRRLAIESISSGPNDAARGGCDSTENQSCSRFVGSLLVGFSSNISSSEEGDNDDDMWEVGNNVLQQVAADMSSDAYLAALNLALEEESEGVSVTRLSYVDTDFYDSPQQESDSQQQESFSGLRGDSYVVVEEGGLTTLGKALMPILALMFIAMLAACFLGYRSRGDGHDGEEKRESSTLVSEEDGIFVDRETLVLEEEDDIVVDSEDRDYREDIFVDSEDYDYEYSEDKSYFSADMHDLGKCHTKMDVGRCSKASCSACSPQPLPFIEEGDAPSQELDETASMDEECAGEECTYVQPLQVSRSPIRMYGMLGMFGSPPMVEAMEEAQETEEAMEEPQEMEEAMEEPQEELEEEPKTVSFVKVNGPEGIEYEHLGIRRQVIDQSGMVRNEIEL